MLLPLHIEDLLERCFPLLGSRWRRIIVLFVLLPEMILHSSRYGNSSSSLARRSSCSRCSIQARLRGLEVVPDVDVRSLLGHGSLNIK